MSTKISGYQKLKQENEKLKADLSVLANHPESKRGIMIKFEWVTKASIETAIWAGDVNNQSYKGIIKAIAK
jgi:hypothetical protein